MFIYDKILITTQPGRSHHQSPEADVRGNKAAPASHRFAGASGGRRDFGRIFFMTFSLSERRGPGDFSRFFSVSDPCEVFWPTSSDF
jgi:hypothetical protein